MDPPKVMYHAAVNWIRLLVQIGKLALLPYLPLEFTYDLTI